ncbi:HNH endonuclease [Pseudomonas sp.]|uniref:HNH endonuclease n=1 Tax=Pseudomonas sp. TaxID=306 RepID=UPI003241EBB5
MAKRWTQDDLLIALGLYCLLPFGQFHRRQPLIIRAAETMQRTPDSVAMKLSNLASLDPEITGSGRKGLAGASELDRQMWSNFTANTEAMMPLAEQALASAIGDAATSTEDIAPSYHEADHFSEVKVRKGQGLFRSAVLSAYDNRCCVTGLTDSRFLIASHIRPWRTDNGNRLNPSNGLCLSLMFDKAFDTGLITFSEDYRLVLSSNLRAQENNPYMAATFFAHKDTQLRLPNKFAPSASLLNWHRNHCFTGVPL